MADLKISQLNSLAGSSLANTDVLAVVDTSASETKKITSKELVQYGYGLVDPSTLDGNVIEPGTTSARGTVQLTDSTGSTSTTTAATPNAVKSAYDLANAALPKAGGTMTGQILGDDSTSASTPGYAFDGDPNTGIYSPGADQVAISTAGTGRVFVDASGNVGVGTIPVANTLIGAARGSGVPGLIELAGNGNTVGSSGFAIGQDVAGVATLFQRANAAMYFATNGAERLRITSTGELNFTGAGTAGVTQAVSFNGSAPVNSLVIDSTGKVGIGTSSPSFAVDVSAANDTIVRVRTNGNTSAGFIGSTNNGTNNWFLGSRKDAIGGSTGTDRFNLLYDTNTFLTVTSDGKVGIGTSSPGYLLEVSRNTSGDAVAFTASTDRLRPLVFSSSDNTASGAVWTRKIDSAYGAHAWSINGSERARIDSSGRLLVGTSSARTNWFNISATGPLIQTESNSNQMGVSSTYTANNSSGPIIALGKTRGSLYEVVSSGDDAGVITFQGGDGAEMVEAARITAQIDGTPGANDMPGRLVFSTTADGASSPTERMRITNAGNLNVFSGDVIYARSSAAAGFDNYLYSGWHSATGTTNGTLSFAVYTNGNVQNTLNAYGALSDIKLKENIVDANSQWSDLKALQVRNYNFKEGETHTQIGLVAQEVELVSPGLVTESPDRDAEGNDLGTVTKSVNYSVLYMKAVKALQEAMERIEQLEQRLTDAGIA